jgi:hypothetical protein
MSGGSGRTSCIFAFLQPSSPSLTHRHFFQVGQALSVLHRLYTLYYSLSLVIGALFSVSISFKAHEFFMLLNVAIKPYWMNIFWPFAHGQQVEG